MKSEMGIGDIGNYYGGLLVKEQDGKFFWGIENHDGTSWEEIPFSLYAELVKFEQNNQKTSTAERGGYGMNVSVDGEKVVVTTDGNDTMGYPCKTGHYLTIHQARLLFEDLNACLKEAVANRKEKQETSTEPAGQR